jgi:hypothetical protein
LAAQVTPYVPNFDPAYVDVDVLVSEGWVQEVIAGERPYSRGAFARLVEEAQRRTTQRELTPRSREALERLTRRFGAERSPPARGGLRAVHVETTLSDSPSRPMRPGEVSSIEASVNPLLQGNQGRELADGFTWAAEGQLDWSIRFVAGQLRPRVWLDIPRGPEAIGVDGTLLEAYARALVGPLGLEVGRNHVAVGQGGSGAALSHNARGLDMVRVTSDRPLRLPGPFGVLGLWQPSALVATMGDNRSVPGSLLTIFRLGARPSRHIELGFTYMNQQAGEGAPEATLRERLHDILLFWTDGGALEISDKVVGADLRVTVPTLRTQLYVNALTTDDRGRFSQPAGGLWEDALWVAGASVTGLGPGGRLDARLQWVHAGAIYHTHHQFSAGLALDGRVLGDALGPNGAGVRGAISWNGPDAVLTVTGAWEHYSGDDWMLGQVPGGDVWDLDWYLIADNPDEIRRRVAVDWTRSAGPGDLETSVRLGYEHVTRYAYGTGDRSNLLASFRVGYAW